jgi:hypothetical protein
MGKNQLFYCGTRHDYCAWTANHLGGSKALFAVKQQSLTRLILRVRGKRHSK